PALECNIQEFAGAKVLENLRCNYACFRDAAVAGAASVAVRAATNTSASLPGPAPATTTATTTTSHRATAAPRRTTWRVRTPARSGMLHFGRVEFHRCELQWRVRVVRDDGTCLQGRGDASDGSRSEPVSLRQIG